MNNITPMKLREESRISSDFDERKRAENLAQLNDEAESRARRIKMRKARQSKLEVLRRQKRRSRAFKLAAVWVVVIATGFFAATWYSKDIVQWMASNGGLA